MSNHNPRTYYIRPSWAGGLEPKIDPILVAQNAQRGIGTTILLDTNILIHMEKVVKGGNKIPLLKRHGLHNLVSLLNRCPPNSIALSPGRAFTEMPPALATMSAELYEAFCEKHLPGFSDVPNCIRKIFSGQRYDYGYLDLDPMTQGYLAIPYAALLYLNIVDKKCKGSPIQKFEEFLKRMVVDLDVLCAKEIQIAKYCLSEPPPASLETIRLKRRFRANFLKTKQDKSIHTGLEATAVAFNGACDLTLMNVANTVIVNGFDGTPQDCWIATRDEKLVELSKVFNYIDIPENSGKFALTTVLPEHDEDHYWLAANELHQSLAISRMVANSTRVLDLETLIAKAKCANDEALLIFG